MHHQALMEMLELGRSLVRRRSFLGILLARLQHGERISEFDIFLHFVCPLASTIALIWVGVQSRYVLRAPSRYWLDPYGMAVALVFMERLGRESGYYERDRPRTKAKL
jgi:hypothetical protein